MNLSVLIRTILRHKVNQKLTKEAFKVKQLKRFRQFIQFVNKRSPYYTEIIKQNQIDLTTCLPEHFPILTKQDLMNHFDAIVTNPKVTKAEVAQFFQNSKDPNELFKNQFYAIHSSGTSGELTYFVYSKKDWARGAAQNFRMSDPSLKKRKIAFYGMTGGHYAGASFASTANKSIFKWLYEVRLYDVNDPMDPIIESLNQYQPDIIMGYPGSIKKLAEKQLNQELHIDPNLLQVSGEVLHEQDRFYLEKAFQAKVVNAYSCSDQMLIGIGMPEYQGMYLMEDDFIFDIQEDGLIITNLFNRTLPLIRYKMGDIVIPQEVDHQNIFPFIKVQEIVGRTENAPVFVNKHGEQDAISQHTIGEIFVEDLKGLQLEVIDLQFFKVYIIIDDHQAAEVKNKVKSDLNHELKTILLRKEMDNVQFEIEEIKEMIADKKTGKYNLILPPSLQ